MDLDERRRLLSDVVEQIGELTLLMNDLIDLARGEEPSADTEDLRLDLLVSEVAERHAPARAGHPAAARAGADDRRRRARRLERAVANLLDNAVKYSPPDEPVEIELAGEELTVRDHGPGISAEI